ncbi:unnamed protein product [Boreogadus saida]
MVIFSTLVYHCGTPRYMEPHILGWRPLMLRLIYFLFLRPSLMTSMCSLSSLWPPLSSLSSLWPPLSSLSSLWPPLSSLSSLWPPLQIRRWWCLALLQNFPMPYVP